MFFWNAADGLTDGGFRGTPMRERKKKKESFIKPLGTQSFQIMKKVVFISFSLIKYFNTLKRQQRAKSALAIFITGAAVNFVPIDFFVKVRSSTPRR